MIAKDRKKWGISFVCYGLSLSLVILLRYGSIVNLAKIT